MKTHGTTSGERGKKRKFEEDIEDKSKDAKEIRDTALRFEHDAKTQLY